MHAPRGIYIGTDRSVANVWSTGHYNLSCAYIDILPSASPANPVADAESTPKVMNVFVRGCFSHSQDDNSLGVKDMNAFIGVAYLA